MKIRRGKKTIVIGFMTTVFIVMTAGQLMLGGWFLFDQKGLHRDLLMDRAGLTARLISKLCVELIKDGKYDELQTVIENIGDDDIISIKVMDKEGMALLYKDFKKERRDSSRIPFYVPWKNEVTAPLLSGGEKIGSVDLVYSGSSANAIMLNLLTKPALAQVMIFLIVIYAVYFFFQKKIGSPIDVLRNRMERITDGDLSVNIPDMGENEIGMIGTGLQFIVKRLSSATLRMHATAESVDKTVSRLNSTFQDFTDMLRKQTSSTDSIVNSIQNANISQKNTMEISGELSGFSSENVSALLEVRAMSNDIVSSMESLFKATENSYSTVAQMAQTSKVMSKNSNEMLTSVDNTSASVQEVIASVKEVERNAKKSSSLAESVREEASKRGVVTVAEAVEGMRMISKKVEYSMDMVRQLHKRSMDIERILSVIKEVNEQTSLLSLNAAILAEKAGEHGKGFSVVADEMRALSDRTSTYTKEIGGILKTIQKEVKDVVSSIEAGVQMVKEGSDRVYVVGEIMSDILEEAHNSALMTRTIERSTEEQVKALEHVERSMIDMSTMAIGMSRAMDEQIEGSDYMLEKVGEVREIAEITKKGTDEQAAATNSISQNFELANEKLSSMSSSISSQQRVNDSILASVEEIRNDGLGNIRKMEDVSRSLDDLLKEIQLLRKEMEVFRI